MADSDLRARELRGEYRANPLGIDVPRPRLGWSLASPRRGARQSAYRVLVATTRERVLAGDGDLWDSGRVASARSTQVVYAGAPLRSGQRAWWSVQVWDGDGRAAPPSDPAWWEMGLLAAADWDAVWIGLDPPPRPPASPTAPTKPGTKLPPTALDLPPSPFLRCTFVLPAPVRRARLYATARGLSELRLNGERVGDAVLAPGWTDYAKRIQYQTHDVASLLRDGENALGAILGTGWYAGHVGWGNQTRHYGPAPRLLLQLAIDLADGTTETIVSDGAWRATTDGPIRASDLLMGETYDARREMPGWDAPGFADGDWASVRAEPRDAVRLVADRAAPVRVVEELAPVEITEPSPGTRIVDMGQNMVGWVRLRASGPAGTAIRLRFGEVVNPDGSLYTANLRSAHQTDTVVLAGTGAETFEPRFTFHGFRYVEVTGAPDPLAPGDIVGRVVESETAEAGSFVCSDPLINQLQRNIVWGQRGNFLSIPTDCPQRDERLGWLADAQVFAPTACFNRDVAAFFTKWLEDVDDARSPAGAFPNVAPRLVDATDGAPAWGDGGVVLPWTLHRFYGDTRLIERHFDAMAGWLAYVGAANPDRLWRHRRNNDFGDWLAHAAETPKELLATAAYARSARLLAEMAATIGRDGESARFATLFAEIKAAFVAAYVGPDGRVAGGTQTGYVLALATDLLPGDLRPAAARHLVADIERRGGHLSTGFAGVADLLPVLAEAGYPDVAYRLLRQETLPSWGHMIRHGATTIWERWDGWTPERGFQDPGMNSFNHYALGSVGAWLYRSVAGIDLDPADPGFGHVLIRPRPGGGLSFARATYRSIRGPIASGWEIADGTLTLRVRIPANVTATVAVPTADPGSVTEGDRPATAAEGVRFLRAQEEAALFAIGSGAYEFRARSPSAGAEPGPAGPRQNVPSVRRRRFIANEASTQEER